MNYFVVHLKHSKSTMCCAVLSCSVISSSLQAHGRWPARLFCLWGFSRQEYRSGLLCPAPGDLPNSAIQPRPSTLQVISFTIWATREAQEYGSGWPIPSPGYLPNPGIKHRSPAWQVDSSPTEVPGKPNIEYRRAHIFLISLFVLLKLTSPFNTGYLQMFFIGFHFFWSSCLVFPLVWKQCISLKWLWTDMKKYNIYSLKHFLHGFSCFFFIIQCHSESLGLPITPLWNSKYFFH